MEETVLSQHGLCAGNQCVAIFQEPKTFSEAQTKCKSSDGKLFETNSDSQVPERLFSGINGNFWLGTATKSAGSQSCFSVYALVGHNLTSQQKPCEKKLDGYVCQYQLEEPCKRLEVDEGALVRYNTSHKGFEVKDSETFPQGTMAVAEKAGVKYPDTKHLCFSKTWLRAPWNCEVMQGGCEHGCNSTTGSCNCPTGETLHPNNITCTKDPCKECQHTCQRGVDTHVCKCNTGYKLAKDGKRCVDINECKEKSPCTGEGEECVNTEGGFQCNCKDDYVKEDGVCVNVSICSKCEHMDCEKLNGIYQCKCREGFRVAAWDPTKCEIICTKQDCLAKCNYEADKEPMDQVCYCPEGYIKDLQNNTVYCTDIDECDTYPCQHTCENVFGSFSCSCNEYYELDSNGHDCVPRTTDYYDGSGSPPTLPPEQPTPPASPQPAILPPYIKTGSILGITLFMSLCAVLVCFVVRNMFKRCSKLELPSIKGADIDIFYLQQVTTETYKRLSIDKQFKTDSQRL
ncbi:thrombomodulin-like [Scomber scombrus]|uniref:Thrombomodulin n=1 Tax=Scomber scombrus TaxID=13677 RepID=A0AAV1PGD5_SCOSC